MANIPRVCLQTCIQHKPLKHLIEAVNKEWMTSFKDENIVVEATTFGLVLRFISIVMVNITVIHFISNGILHLAYWKLFGENYIRVKVDPALME